MNIREDRLAWRWTDPKHGDLPPDTLAQIYPVDAASAATIHDQWMPCFDEYGNVIRDNFARVETCSTEGTWRGDSCSRQAPLFEQVTDWLRVREPNLKLPVTISWERDCAVRTNWGIFTEWWDDFCYPVSDDVFIVPEQLRWFLAYHHHDRFTFCHAPSVGRAR